MITIKLGNAIEGKNNNWTTNITVCNYANVTLKRVALRKDNRPFEEIEKANRYSLRANFNCQNPIKDDELNVELDDIDFAIDDEQKIITLKLRAYKLDEDLHEYLEKKRAKLIDEMGTDDIIRVSPRI